MTWARARSDEHSVGSGSHESRPTAWLAPHIRPLTCVGAGVRGGRRTSCGRRPTRMGRTYPMPGAERTWFGVGVVVCEQGDEPGSAHGSWCATWGTKLVRRRGRGARPGGRTWFASLQATPRSANGVASWGRGGERLLGSGGRRHGPKWRVVLQGIPGANRRLACPGGMCHAARTTSASCPASGPPSAAESRTSA